MSPAAGSLRAIIAAARNAVRRDALFAVAAAIVMVVPVALLFVWLLGLRTSIAHHLPLVIDLVAFATAIAVGLLARHRWLQSVTDRRVAAHAETQHGFAEGELQGLLEMGAQAPAGTSDALLRRAEQSYASRLAGAAPVSVAGLLAQQARRRRTRVFGAAGALTAVVLLLAFASPERSRAAWSPLMRPIRTIAATAYPALSVAPGNATVARGTDVPLSVHAAQREAVTLYWRARGDVLHEQTLPVLGGHASASIQNIDASVKYWVKAPDGAATDTFTLTPLDPLLVSGLSVDVLYPAYLQRTPEHFDKDVPPLELPRGTELRIHGRSTRTLSSAALLLGSQHVDLAVNGSSFSTSWHPSASGTYTWQLNGATALDAAAAPAPLEITVVDDAPPQLEVTYPGVDTLLPGDMKQLLVADASDDHAVIAASVVSWRTSMTGERDAPVEQPLAMEGDVDRKLIRGTLDASARRLLPGDTLSYYVRVVDNSPAHQSTMSRTYTLRVPGMEEMRDRAQSQADELVKDAQAVAKAMDQLEQRTHDLQRQTATGAARSGSRGAGGAPGQQDHQLSNEQAEQAKAVLKQQEALTDEVQKLRDRIESMQHAAEQAGLNDPEVQKRMEELKQLYDQLLTPEMKKQMQELQQALEKLDPDQVQKALENLAKQQQQLREKLDQSLELMRRAAAEQEMSKLTQEAKELSTQQQALSQDIKQGNSNPQDNADKQKQIDQKTQELNGALARLAQKLGQQGEANASSRTAQAQQQTKDAQDQMSQAAKEASQNHNDKAAQAGQQAADQLNDVAKTLDAARKDMTAEWKKDVQQDVDNATQDAISLAQMQKNLLDRMQASAHAGDTPPPDQQSGGQKSPTPGMQQGNQQGSRQGSQSKEKGQQQGGKAGQQGQGQKSGGQQGSNNAAGGQPGGGNSPQQQLQQMRSDQAAVKQGLEQLGKNLQDAGQRTAMVNREVGAALARANLSMDQTLKALEQATPENMPDQQAAETVDALNRLALELIKNGQQIDQSESGTGLQEALKQLADLAKQQGALNGRSSSLLPLNLGPKVMSQQIGALAREQRDIADKLSGMNKGGARDDLLGRLDDLVKEADQIARDMQGGRLAPETLQRQSELFHKLLDAGKTMERNDVSQERKAEAAEPLPPAVVRALRPGLFDANGKYATPTAEQLKDLPPAYRRLILEYFQKLNATAAPKDSAAAGK